MEPTFWHERWENRNTPFHEGDVNQFLSKHFPRLAALAPSTILVPLCGKAVDLAWLRGQGHEVLGVELSPIAVRDFFQEHHIEAHESVEGAFTRLEGDGIALLCGDFFALNAAQLETISGVYDRAAIVALPESLRGRYVDTLLGTLPDAVPILMLTLEYDSKEMNGPPFSVTEAEVRQRFSAHRNVERLESCPILESQPGLRKRGLSWLVEHTFLLT